MLKWNNRKGRRIEKMSNIEVLKNEKIKKKRGFTLKKLFTAVFIVFLIFLILKLTNIINWSWIWVLSPLWIGVLFAIFFTSFAVLVWMFLYKMMTGKNPFR